MGKQQRFSESSSIQQELSDWGMDTGESAAQTERAWSDEEALAQKIWETNEGLKRINGHSPEYVAEHIGVDVEELFPEQGRSVYIGDPWQKLDRKGVTIVDYEFGPIAEFQSDRQRYVQVLRYRLSQVGDLLAYVDDVEVKSFLLREVGQGEHLLKKVEEGSIGLFPLISAAFSEMKDRIEEEIQRENKEEDENHPRSAGNPMRDLWYTAIHGARAIDVYDWEVVLEPKLDEYAKGTVYMDANVRDERLKEKKRELIEEVRFEVTAKEAEVVRAMFPFLPFEDGSFDRFVAFWSITTYAFEHLDEEELTRYWQEIYRVLKDGGRAYLQPIFEGNEYFLIQTLKNFAQEKGDFQFQLDHWESPNRLVIYKQKEPVVVTPDTTEREEQFL